MDVAPMSLGIELASGKMSVIIARNTNIPYAHTRMYYNNEDNQKEAIIVVFEVCRSCTCGSLTVLLVVTLSALDTYFSGRKPVHQGQQAPRNLYHWATASSTERQDQNRGHL